MKIAILGGTGDEGSGLGFRWALAGHDIIIGSRKAEKAVAAAADLNAKLETATVVGMGNAEAAASAELVVLSVPYWAQAGTLDGLRHTLTGKILLTVVAPLGKAAARYAPLESGTSAAQEAQTLLGEEVRVVAAFQNISAHHLVDPDHVIDCDVLICGRKKADKEVVTKLCADAGMRGVNAGSLANAAIIEGMTALLIGINIRHKIKDAGIRITGIE